MPFNLRAQWTYLGLAAFVAVLWLATLSSRPLFNPDEGRYAEIPREMLATDDWVIPHLNGVAYIEKPPLQYWATALSLRAFGRDAFAARLYPALCALGTLVVVWLLAAELWSAAAAWRTSSVLAGMLLFVVLGQHLTLDMSLTFYMTLALSGFLLAQPRPVRAGLVPGRDPGPGTGPGPGPARARETPQPLGGPGTTRRWMLIAWAAAALGVLTKGLVAAAIPLAVLLLHGAYSRDFSPWRRLQVAWGLPLFLVVSVPWHWLAARRLPDFLQFFFVHEHVSRYLTPSADREAPWWFFGVVFVLGTIPWTASALRVVSMTWRRRVPRGEFDTASFLWLWVVFVCLFFSFSDSKLIPYILPAMPAVALLIGASPADALRRDVSFTAIFTVLAGAVSIAAGVFGPHFLAPSDRSGYFLLLAKPLLEIGALLAMTGMFVMLRCRRDLTRAAVFLGVGWCLSGLLLMRAAAVVAPVYSGIGLVRALQHLPAGAPVYSVATYDQTLPFYWQRTLTLVAYRGELDFGLRHDPGAEIPTVTEFLDRWQAVPDGYAVMEKAMFDDLKNRGVPMRELARDVHRVLVARR